MLKYILFAMLLMMAQFSSGSYAGNFNCDSFNGKPTPIGENDQKVFNSIAFGINSKNMNVLKSASGGAVLFIRRFESENHSRGGNIWAKIKTSQIDPNMNIHFQKQIITDFGESAFSSFSGLKDGIYFNRNVCNSEPCDLLPVGAKLDHMIYGILKCNPAKNSLFMFSDGALVTDLELIDGLPVGVAFFLSKNSNRYHLGALVTIQ